MLDVICWRWGTRYGVEYVNRLQSMLRRHLHLPHRLHCITDDPEGLCPGIIPFPIWDAEGLGRARRLRIFDPKVAYWFGKRLLQMDIDCVVTGDITPLVDRPEPLVMWRSVPEIRYTKGEMHPNGEDGRGAYNASLILMNAGVMPTIWSDYQQDPDGVELKARKAGMWTLLRTTYKSVETSLKPIDPRDDDQAVISLYAKDLNPPTWLEQDGVYKYGRRGFQKDDELPDNARIVFLNASVKGSLSGLNKPWIGEHWL